LELLFGVFSAFGLSASAGLNAYIPLLVVALLARFTPFIKLNAPWDVLSNGWIIGLLVLLSVVEFFADKIPAVNHVNDVIQTFIRPTAGAIAFAASARVISDMHPVLALALGLLVAGGVHIAKSAVVRPAVTATTAGIANVPISIAEDLVSTIVSLIAAIAPVVIAVLFIAVLIWILDRFSRRRKAV